MHNKTHTLRVLHARPTHTLPRNGNNLRPKICLRPKKPRTTAAAKQIQNEKH